MALRKMWGFFVAAQSHADAHSPPHRGMGEGIGCVEVRKLVGWYRDGLMDKTKAAQASEAK